MLYIYFVYKTLAPIYETTAYNQHRANIDIDSINALYNLISKRYEEMLED